MVQVIRWYLSAYHAGRKSTVAKKPYNPILGEIFQCHWDIPSEQIDPIQVEDGPIPWCRRDQLTFISEQVSHHPPSKPNTHKIKSVVCLIMYLFSFRLLRRTL